MSWQETMKAAEAAKDDMIRDRSSGESKFQQLLRRNKGDGMVYFQRGVAYEALNELAKAIADFTRAEALFPKTEWKAAAREALDRVNTPQKTGADSSQYSSSEKSRRVFVVHGRNEKLREGIFIFLRSIGLEPLAFLKARKLTGNPAPYIGEILDAAFQHAQAVVVMLTPDDDVRLGQEFQTPADPPYERDLTRQARPNVIFEAGMALASHPKQTILVQIGKVKPFSDILGRHLVYMDNSPQMRQEFASRLRDAGCSVNLEETDWHTAGSMAVEANSLEVKFGGPTATRERTGADWADIDHGIMDTYTRLLKDDFFPEVLICSPGTSLVVTELLAIKLENQNPAIPIHVLETKEADGPLDFIGEGQDYLDVDSTGYRYLIPPYFARLRGQKALIFDDGLVTGRTLFCLKQKLSGRQYQIEVRTAVLFAGHDIKGLGEALRPDYIHRFVSISDFYMPWGHILQNKRLDPKKYVAVHKP